MRDLKEQYYGSFRRGFEVEKLRSFPGNNLKDSLVNCMGIIGFYMITGMSCTWGREIGTCIVSL